MHNKIFLIPSGPVHHEYCDCPESDVAAWQRVMQCPEEDPQIQEDFSSFPSIDLQQLLQEVPMRFAKRGGLIHYTILNNQVHRRSLGKYTDFKMFSDEILLSLARKVRFSYLLFLFHIKTVKKKGPKWNPSVNMLLFGIFLI